MSLKTARVNGPVYKFSENENEEIKQGDLKEIQVLREGDYHVSKVGKVEVTRNVLLSMIDNFEKKVKPNEPSLDFVHDSANRAAAWVKKLFTKINSDNKMELWSLSEITGAGANELSQKNFKYTSADFTLNYVDNETLKEHGPLLEGLALTNRPVVKGMQAIMLSEKTGVLDMTLEEALAMIESLKLEIEEMKKKLPKAEIEVEMSEDDKPKSELEVKLSERIKTLEAQSKEMKFNDLLAKGRLVPSQKEAYLKGDMDTVLETAQAIKFSEVGTKKAGDGEVSVEDQIKKVMDENKNLTFSEATKIVTRKNSEKMKEELYKNYKM